MRRNQYLPIIEEFARRGNITDSIGACVWCGEILVSRYGVRYMQDGKPCEHKGSCILGRARELVKPLAIVDGQPAKLHPVMDEILKQFQQ